EGNLIKGLLYGASGILNMKAEPDSLVASIQTVHEGHTALSDVIADDMIQEVYKLVNDKKENPYEALQKQVIHLTPRAYDVVNLLVDKQEILYEALQKEGIHLRPPELDVVDLFRFGLTNEQIAKRLSLSAGTIKNYISNIYQEFGIHNRSEAINYMYELLKK